MAQIQVQGKLDGTTTRSVLTITEITRDSNNTSFSLNFTTNLVSSSGYIGTSESLSGIVQISANGMTTQAKTVILKSSSENWSGTTIHKKNDTFNVTIPVSVTNISIKYTLKHSPSNDSATGNASMTLTKLVSLLNPFENNNELNLENPLTLSIVKYDSTYTNNLILYYKNDNNLTQLASWGNVEDGQIIQLNENQLENLYNLTSSSKTYALTWDLITLDGSTNLGDSKLEATGLITNANPIFTDFDFADINPITTAVTSNNQSIVGGVSTLQITIPTTKKATALKGASIVSYIISDKAIDYSTSEITKTIPRYNSSKIIVSAVDTRGNTTTVQKIITDFILYSPITINQTSATISRTNNIDEETKISFEGTFWNSNFGKADNSLSIAYKYRLKGSSNAYTTGVTTITPTISNNSFSVTNKAILGDTNSGFDVSKSYEIIVEVSDKLSVNEIDYTLNPGKNAIEIVGNEVKKINDILFENLLLPSGSVIEYAGDTAPNGWLICDGSAISREIYANLFEVIGSTFGGGDGTTTFNIPNLKGKIPVGLNSDDSDFNILGKAGGEKTHILTSNEMPSHNHRQTVTASRSGSGTTYASWNAGNLFGNTDTGARNTLNTGGGQAHNNLQPYITLNYIIKY